MNITGEQMYKTRAKLGLNQAEFWKTLGVTQSGGSRYENDRNIPVPVQRLYWLTYVVELTKHLSVKDSRTLASIGK